MSRRSRHLHQDDDRATRKSSPRRRERHELAAFRWTTTLAAVGAALDALAEDGPALGPPLADAVAPMSAIHAGLELLRAGGSDWTRWYSESVPLAHARYIQYLRERAKGGNA